MRYEIVRQIGVGGFCEVLEVEDPRTKQRFALKRLLPHLSKEPQVLKFFRREIRIMHGLLREADGVIRTVGASYDPETPYLLMELAECSLADVLTAVAIPEELSVRWFLQILSGVENAHKNRIIHRDLKPENILLFERGRDGSGIGGILKAIQNEQGMERWNAVVSDFGIGKVSLAGTSSSHGQAIVGTLGYIAPEVLSGTIADVRADVFALGKILYQMLTAPGSVADEIHTNRIPFNYMTLIQRMTDYDKEERLRTISDVRICLLDISHGSHEDPNIIAMIDQLARGGDRRNPELLMRYHDAINLYVIMAAKWVLDQQSLQSAMKSLMNSIGRIRAADDPGLHRLVHSLRIALGQELARKSIGTSREIVEFFADLGHALSGGETYEFIWATLRDLGTPGFDNDRANPVRLLAQIEFERFCINAERHQDLEMLLTILNSGSSDTDYWRDRLLRNAASLPSRLRDGLDQD